MYNQLVVIYMEINLQELNYKKEISVDEKISYSSEFLKDTEIIRLDNVNVLGTLTTDIEFNCLVNFKVSGEMIIYDAVTYEEVPYEFAIDIEENLGNSLKSLDLIEFLWHYIVLEIPLRYTLSEEMTSVETDNYRVISEEEYNNKNNPFKDFFLE